MSMASILDELRCLSFFLHSTTILKATIAACTTLHLYYTALNFDEEVEYIWSKKWSLGKIMYLLTRYLGSLFLICANVGFMGYRWEDAPYLLRYLLSNIPSSNFFTTCFRGRLFSVAGPLVIIPPSIILQMRVYALYGRKKFMLIFFILLNLAFVVYNTLPLFVPHIFDMAGVHPLNRCFDKRGLSRRSFLPQAAGAPTCLSAVGIPGIGWGITCVIESIEFIMVVVKARPWSIWARKNRDGMPRPSDMTTTLARDSIYYFAIMFTIFIIAAFCESFARSTEPQLMNLIFSESIALEVIVITIMTILAPRIILNLRAVYYGREDLDSEETGLNLDLGVSNAYTSRSAEMASYVD